MFACSCLSARLFVCPVGSPGLHIVCLSVQGRWRVTLLAAVESSHYFRTLSFLSILPVLKLNSINDDGRIRGSQVNAEMLNRELIMGAILGRCPSMRGYAPRTTGTRARTCHGSVIYTRLGSHH